MEAKDLMIGCLYRVKKDVCLPNGTIVIIRGIDADNRFPEKHLVGSATCLPINNEYGFTYGVWVEYLEPIPLTPEILEKNEFSDNYAVDDQSYAVDGGGDVVGVHIIGKGGIMDEMYFKYVHQLQQALRLCGIEKEIIL